MAALTTIWFGCANACRRAARFGVSPTTAVSDAVPSPIWSPTITGPVAMPIRTASSTPGGLRDRGIQLRHRIDDIETRPHRTLGLVLMGARVAEIDEDAVAHVLRDKAVVAPDRGTAPALKRRDHIAQIFGVHPGGECGRSHQVAKHHGQLAALGLRRRGWRGRPAIRARRRGRRPLGVPQGRQWLRQRRALGSGHAPLGRPDETLAVDIRRQPLDADQLATEFFETIVIETEAELDTAIGDAALGDEAPDDLLQHLLKVHASAPVAATFVPALGPSMSRRA